MRPAPLAAWIAVTLTGAVLCFVPLFNLIGYESSAVLGVVVGIAAMVVTADAFARGAIPAPTAPSRGGSPAADFCWLLPRTVGLVAPPLALLALNALRVKNCDPSMGLEFTVLIPVVSALVGQGLVWGAALLTRNPLAQVGVALSVVGADLLWFVYRLAVHPPITGHSLLFGWFAGSIYDEDLSVPGHLWWYRLTVLGAVASVVMLSELLWARRTGRPQRAPAWGLAAFLLPTLYGYAQFEDHNIGLERADIIERLGGTVETEHFIIHYDPAETSTERLERMVEDHEFRYAEMSAWLDTDPVTWRGRKLRSVVYPNRRQQERLMGSRGTLVARPWTHEMHIRYDGYRDGALAHELAHLFTAPFGGGPLQLATRGGLLPDIGLLEGIAMAADWPVGDLDPHEAAAAMRQLDIAPDIRSVFSPTGFWSQPLGKAYTLMGSFVRWLVDTHGIERFQQAYANGDFEGVYGAPAVDLVADWEAYVDEIAVSESKLELARFRYKRKSIFGKTCARTVADLKRQAWISENRGDYETALALWDQIRGFNKRGSDEGKRGLEEAELLAKLDRTDDATAILDNLLERTGKRRLRPAMRAKVLELKGDLLWQADRGDEGIGAWSEALTLGVSDGTRRQLQVKLRAASSDDPFVRRIGRDYLLNTDGARSALFEALTWARAQPADPIPRYLVGVQLYTAQEYAAAVDLLAGPEGTLPTVHLDEQRRRLLGTSLFWLHRLDEADAALSTLVDSESSRQAEYAREMRDRAAWLRALGATTPEPAWTGPSVLPPATDPNASESPPPTPHNE